MPIDASVAASPGGDDLASTDEVKVYKDEGDDENRENLTEDKLGLVTETEEGKSSGVEDKHFLRTGKPEDESGFFGSAAHYPIGSHLPFGYPLMTTLPYAYSCPLGLSGLTLTPGGFPFYMYNNDLFSQPHPAHLALPVPWKLGSHTGFASRPSSMYGFVGPSPASPAATPSPYGIHPSQTPPLCCLPTPYCQFPPSFCRNNLSSPVSWSSSAMSLHSPYQLSRFGHKRNLSPPPSMLPSTPHHTAGLSLYPRVSHRSMIKTPELDDTGSLSTFSDQARHVQLLSCRHSSKTSSNTSHHHTIKSSTKSYRCYAGKMPHIKKPLNAFMIFMKEMRQKVIDECTLKESAAINQILGRKWHSLDRSEQAKYYEMAQREKELHRKLYPTWSARDNYAIHSRKKRRRDRVNNDKMLETDDDRECQNAKKCRARFGLDKQNQWCKPCRRKKRCIRFIQQSENNMMEEEDDTEWVERLPCHALPADSTTGFFSPLPSSLSSTQEEGRIQAPIEEPPHPGSASSIGSGSVMSCDDGAAGHVLSESLHELQLMGHKHRLNFGRSTSESTRPMTPLGV